MNLQRLRYLVVLLMLTSCKEKVRQGYDASVIDREKIDKVFGHDVSQVLFDHLYIVLDSVTYDQLTQHDVLKDTYASLDNGLPDFKAVDESMTSCYMRGHEHYIELLGPNNEYNEPVGKSGIGFALRNKGEHFHLGVNPKLKQSGTPYLSVSETVEMPLGEEKATWFKAFYSPNSGTALHTWYAFYNPAFLDSLHRSEHQEYTREAFLKDSYSKKQLFEGINSINMICTPKDYERIVQEMRQLGCRLISKEGKTLTIASGDVSIAITPSARLEFSRITHIACGLNAMDTSTTTLGNLTITNTGTQSIWNLENLYKNNP
ncbi:DUF5829 family protein [Costertonia aggregata]|uniref:Uncharacterized protein n=1 Tax=Costertonia aggregata TaxID=343403 RepID=A0A7H9ANA8_9FLAO|nr:DUF5829 family protein [Costertonia aggregata]QLG44920.1 hypothetical protein HYG79_05980 [Costertonia aggregata]